MKVVRNFYGYYGNTRVYIDSTNKHCWLTYKHYITVSFLCKLISKHDVIVNNKHVLWVNSNSSLDLTIKSI